MWHRDRHEVHELVSYLEVDCLGFIGQHRVKQLEDWMWRIIFEETKQSFLKDLSVIHSLPKILEKVRSEESFPWDSADYLLDIYFNHTKKKKDEELE
jgi:hypothetical protein